MCTINSDVKIMFLTKQKRIETYIFRLYVISGCSKGGEKEKRDTEPVVVIMLISCFYSLKALRLQECFLHDVVIFICSGVFSFVLSYLHLKGPGWLVGEGQKWLFDSCRRVWIFRDWKDDNSSRWIILMVFSRLGFCASQQQFSSNQFKILSQSQRQPSHPSLILHDCDFSGPNQ